MLLKAAHLPNQHRKTLHPIATLVEEMPSLLTSLTVSGNYKTSQAKQYPSEVDESLFVSEKYPTSGGKVPPILVNHWLSS